jgi:Fe-S-cluster-containing hydrogenase component 2
MKVIRKIIEIDEQRCDGCGNCVPACAEGALAIIDGKAKVIKDAFCDGIGACIGDCPNDALSIIEREAEEFDEEAVEAHLSKKKLDINSCPSARMEIFKQSEAHKNPETVFKGIEASESGLSHWPVQIMLVPSNAPFLNGAELLVVADCVPLAYPTFHRDFLKGRAVMMGCPKFDDLKAYVDKFTKICNHSGIKRIISLVMEVPCCSTLPIIVRKGLEASGQNIPMEEIVISTRGKVLNR